MGGVKPQLSVVVTVVSDTTEQTDTRHLQGCLRALGRQENPPEMEILVTCDARLAGVDALEKEFPAVRFLRVEKLRSARHGPSREHHDELRGMGIREARGEIVAMLEDHGQPDPRWCAQMAAEHRAPHAAIGGAMENGIDRPLNWAVYFCDFGKYQNPVARGASPYVSDANVSYKRAALDRVAEAWKDAYNETRVHAAMHAAGETLWLSPDIVVMQHRMNLRLGPAVVERYVWGRSYAATRMAGAGLGARLVRAALSPLLPPILLLRYFQIVRRTGRNQNKFFAAVPYLALLTTAWACGEFTGYLTGKTG
jgi:hypothetical protein